MWGECNSAVKILRRYYIIAFIIAAAIAQVYRLFDFFLKLNVVVITFVSSESLDCEPRPRPDSGQAIFTASKNWRRAVEVYQCDAGYVLTGQTKHTCIEGEWSGHVPSCTRPTSSGKWMYFIIIVCYYYYAYQ